VRRFIQIKERVYANAAKFKENPILNVFYACTGNWTDDTYLVEAIKTKKNDLRLTNLFSSVEFETLGASELQALFRQTRTSISREIKFDKLVTMPAISKVKASYLGILPHDEFFKLITDESNEIIKSVFVDNVRDFQGENPVNADIAKTISEGDLDQFVLRNNGITIVAKNIKVTSNKYTIEDYQIVNGCQTSHVLYAQRRLIEGELFVPVKLIHTEDEDVSQSIIKSTNKQTQVEENELYRSQPDEIRLYYERRAKQYAGQSELEKGRIISIGSQLKCYSSMFIELPNQASRYQGTLLNEVKNRVFQQGHKPEPYYVAALALYRFEVLARRLDAADRGIKSFRYYLLVAFRYRYENMEFPGAGNKKIRKYCEKLLENLASIEKSQAAFSECVDIVKSALSSVALPLVRDSAKSRPLIDEVKKLARSRNQAEANSARTNV
jgi:hypothetical protein